MSRSDIHSSRYVKYVPPAITLKRERITRCLSSMTSKFIHSLDRFLLALSMKIVSTQKDESIQPNMQKSIPIPIPNHTVLAKYFDRG